MWRLSLAWVVTVTWMALVAGCAPVVGDASGGSGAGGTTGDGGDALVRATPATVVAPIEVAVASGGARLERFDPPGAGDQLDATVALELVNPNAFDVRLRSFDAVLDLAGDTVYEESTTLDLLIPAEGRVAYTLDVRVPSPREPATIVAVASAFVGEPLPWRLRGPMSFTAGGFRFDVASRTLADGLVVPTRTLTSPTFEVAEDGVSRYELRPGTSVVDVTVAVTNRGDIGTFLAGRDVTLLVDGRVTSTMDVGPVPLPAGETRTFVWSFPVDVGRLANEAADAWRRWIGGDDVEVLLAGAMTVDVLGVSSIPLDGWSLPLSPP